MLILLSSDHRKQIVFLHDAQHSLRISMDSLSLKPDLNSPISICLLHLLLTDSDLLRQRQISIRYLHSFYITVITTSGYFKESAHLADRVFLSVPMDYQVFYTCSHFLSVSERKSRINSFSISSRRIQLSFRASSYCNWVSLLNCCMDGGTFPLSFLGLPLGLISIPAAIFRCFLLYLLKKSCVCSFVSPYLSPISLTVIPCAFNSNISSSYS